MDGRHKGGHDEFGMRKLDPASRYNIKRDKSWSLARSSTRAFT
jgi:hypothetical protein